MKVIDNINKIQEFTNDGVTYGVYSVNIKGNLRILIRNGNSVGAVCYYWGKTASQCVDEIREDIKEEFLELLKE